MTNEERIAALEARVEEQAAAIVSLSIALTDIEADKASVAQVDGPAAHIERLPNTKEIAKLVAPLVSVIKSTSQELPYLRIPRANLVK